MTSPFDVVVCGSLHLDIVVRAPRLPALDETLAGSEWRYVCGGKGRNQAVQAAAAGARVAMIGRVGRDDFGDRLLASLDHAGVDRRGVAIDEAAGSGMSVATVTQAGDYAAVIVSAANLAIDPLSVRVAVGAAPILVLQNEVPEPVNIAAADAARRAGGRVILNAAPARPIGPALAPLVDVLVVNRVEASQMAVRTIETTQDAVAAAKMLGATWRAVVVTLGGDGLVAMTQGSEPVVLPAERVSVVSTHGAGDCFVGTLAARLGAGADLPSACAQANQAAARFVSGAQAR